MNEVRAVLLKAYGGPDMVELGSVDAPVAGQGQVLVRVRAAGINGLDWKVREGYVRDAFPLQLPTVLGIELAGVVEEVGPGVDRLRKGDRVMGPVGGLGAYAELVAVDEENLARVPDALDFVEAAALPIAAVAAWQSLHFAGDVRLGQRVLIQGAASAASARTTSSRPTNGASRTWPATSTSSSITSAARCSTARGRCSRTTVRSTTGRPAASVRVVSYSAI